MPGIETNHGLVPTYDVGDMCVVGRAAIGLSEADPKVDIPYQEVPESLIGERGVLEHGALEPLVDGYRAAQLVIEAARVGPTTVISLGLNGHRKSSHPASHYAEDARPYLLANPDDQSLRRSA